MGPFGFCFSYKRGLFAFATASIGAQPGDQRKRQHALTVRMSRRAVSRDVCNGPVQEGYTGRLVRRINPWWPIGIGFTVVAASLAASALGWLGPLVACGADGAAVCVTWPPLASLGVWLFFIAFIVGLLVL